MAVLGKVLHMLLYIFTLKKKRPTNQILNMCVSQYLLILFIFPTKGSIHKHFASRKKSKLKTFKVN